MLRTMVWSPARPRIRLARLDDLFRVEPGGRLVEDQHLGVVNQRLREADALPVAFRQLRAVLRRHVVDVRALHHGRDPVLLFLRGHALDARDEVQVLPDGHVRIQGRRFRQVAGAPLGLDRVSEDVVAGDRRPTVGWRHVAGQDPHRGGLARPVRTQEPENLSAFDSEADVVHGRDPAVAFGDVFDLNHRSLSSGVRRHLAEHGSPAGAGRRTPEPPRD